MVWEYEPTAEYSAVVQRYVAEELERIDAAQL